MHFIGIDAGTTEIKCVIFDSTGTSVGKGRSATALTYPKPGYVEQDPTEIWKSVKLAVRSALSNSRTSPKEVTAVGITGQSGGTLMLDESRRPLKMISWRDTRAASTVSSLKRNGIEQEFYDITGWPLWPEFASLQLAWLQDNNPELVKETKTVLSCTDWIGYNLTHRLKASASSLIGTIDSKTGRHSERLMSLCGIEKMRDYFPPIADAQEVFGSVDQPAAGETGLAEGTPVISGGYDMACSAAGAGGVTNGQALCVLGTSGTNIIISQQPIRDATRSIVCAYHVVPGLWLAISESMTAVPNLNWFIDQFGMEEKQAAARASKSVFALCDESIQSVPAGSEGLIYHPYLTGETGPFSAPTATASFFGISSSHTRKHFLRAVYEGVGYSIRHNFAKLQSIRDLNANLDSITIVGGGSRSEAWCQMISDIMEKKTVRPNETECGCAGAAMNAAVAVAAFRTFDDATAKFVHLKDEFLPNPEHARTYGRAFEAYSNLIESYKPHWREPI